MLMSKSLSISKWDIFLLLPLMQVVTDTSIKDMCLVIKNILVQLSWEFPKFTNN